MALSLALIVFGFALGLLITSQARAQSGTRGDGHAQMHDLYKGWHPRVLSQFEIEGLAHSPRAAPNPVVQQGSGFDDAEYGYRRDDTQQDAYHPILEIEGPPFNGKRGSMKFETARAKKACEEERDQSDAL